MTATTAAPRRRPSLRALVERQGLEYALFALAVAVIALHVVDDNFLQPQPGISATGHLLSGLVPLAVLGLAARAYPRLRGGRRGALALALGALGAAAGGEAIAYTTRVGPSGDDFTGLAAGAAALLLVALGGVTLWRTRRVEGSRAWRYPRRALLGVAGLFAFLFVVSPIAIAYLTTHVARAVVPAPHLGAAYEDVTFTTSDGLRLSAWYVRSRNGAAVIAFPGRGGPQRHARMLIRHGYGVLLFDRRGEGRSEGEPNAWGWNGERDLTAAIAYLKRRPDVRPRRIGGLGLSVGGELMLQTAAHTRDLRAVVAEGAGSRTAREDLQMPDAGDLALPGAGKWPLVVNSAVRDAALAVFSNHGPPPRLTDLVGRIAPRPVFLIHATHGVDTEALNPKIYAAAGAPKIRWELPEAGHTGAIRARPTEYERRVVGFFDAALLHGVSP
jgi:uncharacterized protein